MTLLGARSAYTCVRCEIRQSLLRRGAVHRPASIASHQARFESTNIPTRVRNGIGPELDHTSKQDTRIYGVKRFKPGIVGRRGRRQAEKSAHLKIKSLDQDSEVIILRDLPEPKAKPSSLPKEDDNDNQEDRPESGPTAEDIQESLSQKPLPTKAEIVEAIEQHRPADIVLSRARFDEVKATLSDSYLNAQLQLYLRKKLPVETSLSTAQSLPLAKLPQQSDISSITRLAISSWRQSSAKSETGVIPTVSSKAVRRKVRQLNKEALIDAILRQSWGLQIEEENEKKGKVDIILSPLQWGLLNTREDESLFATLRGRRFFQRTSFNRDPKKGALVIRGPRTEAEQVAKLFETAFAGAISFEVNLATFEDGRFATQPQELQRRFSRTRLQEVMYMTKTFVLFDKDNLKLQIAGFHRDPVDDATRLLVMMLERPRNLVWRTVPLSSNELIAQEPVNVAKVLPSWGRSMDLYRPIIRDLRSRTISRNAQRLFKQEANFMDESVKLVGDIWPGKGHEGSTHKQVDIHMPGVSSRFWSPDLTVTPIVAKYGLLLSGMAGRSATTSKTLSAGGDLLEIEAGQALTGSAATNGTQFATKIPSLANIVSFCEKMDLREDRKDRSENQHRLIAKLIPSPLAKIEGIDSAELPTIEVEFAISRTDIAITSRSDGHFDGLIDMCRTKQTVASVDEASQTSETALAQTKHKIDEDSHLELVSIRASLKEYAVNVPLPHRYVDVQFSSKLVVEGEIQALLTNVEIKRFIDSIVTTMQRGKELRAPFTTIIPLARSMIPSAQSPSSIKIEDADLALPYFFAGFEHREPRQFRPIYEELPHDIGGIPGGWTVTDIEGGISGGRQLELSVRMDADHAVSEKERDHFVSKALRMTDFIQRVHDGGVPPLARHVKQGTNVNKTAPGVIRHVVAPALHDHTTKESEPREADHMSDVGHSTKDQEWSGFQYFNRRELDGDEEEEEGQQMTTDSRDDEPLRRQAAAMDV